MKLTNEQIDLHLNSVLRASGSALRNYSMQKSLDDMRAAIRAIEAEVLRINGLTAEAAEQREQVQAWAVRTVGGKKWLAIHASKSASDKWLEFKRKEQARSEIYEQIALKEIGVIMESQTISRVDFTGEQLRAAYHPTPPAGVPDGSAGWCKSCGEGVTTFCRGRSEVCAMGLKKIQKPTPPAGVPDGSALYSAAINCRHEIDRDQIVLHFDHKQPGHNALNQLMLRLNAAASAMLSAAPQPEDIPAIFKEQAS